MCCVGVFQGIRVTAADLYESKRRPIPCGKWTCQTCGKKKLKVLYKRIMGGELVKYSLNDGFRSRYAMKLLTLTCPGKWYRERKTPEDAYSEMTKCFDKLIRALKKQNGAFHYIRIREFQQDGYPHFHVVMAGINIAPKEVLMTIRNLWQRKYKMGNVDIQVKKRGQSMKSAIRYILKYVEKEATEGTVFTNKRLFTTSRGALEKVAKNPNTWLFHKFNFRPQGPEDEVISIFEFKAGINIDDVPSAHQRFIVLADLHLPNRLIE